MSRLLATEFRRFWLRRVTRFVFLAIVLLAALLAVTGAHGMARPVTAQERAGAAAAAASTNAGMSASDRAACVQQRDDANAKGEDTSGYFCGDATADQFLRQQATVWEVEQYVPEYLQYLGAIAALVVAGSFVAAEFTTGSLGNQLTFEPRRGRTYAAKLVAAGLGTDVFAVVMAAVTAGCSAATALAEGAATGSWPGGSGHFWWILARAVLALAVLGVAASALATLVRHTAAVTGVALALFVVLRIVANQFGAVMPYELGTNLTAFITGRADYQVIRCSTDSSGYACRPEERTLWLAHGAWELGLATVAVVALGWLVFRRRDVG